MSVRPPQPSPWSRIPFRSIVAERRPLRQRLAEATSFSVQAALCCVVLYAAYGYFHAQGVGWAIVSAILVLIPDLKQSMSAALARVAANVVGAVTGLAVGHALGEAAPAIVVGVVGAAYACYLLRLEVGLRTACVSVIIVMTAHPGSLALSGLERFVAVISGCGVGVAVQLTALAVQNRVARRGERETPEQARTAGAAASPTAE